MTYTDIQGWFDFEKVYDDAIATASDGSILVEVGSWLGKSSAYMGQKILESKKQIEFWCVDHWRGEKDEKLHQPLVEESGGTVFRLFARNIAACGLKSVVRPLVCDSHLAAAYFDDASVDFAFIDAAHDVESVMKDIAAWLPKIKNGGTLAGHDWNYTSVEEAVRQSGLICGLVGNSWVYPVRR